PKCTSVRPSQSARKSSSSRVSVSHPQLTCGRSRTLVQVANTASGRSTSLAPSFCDADRRAPHFIGREALRERHHLDGAPRPGVVQSGRIFEAVVHAEISRAGAVDAQAGDIPPVTDGRCRLGRLRVFTTPLRALAAGTTQPVGTAPLGAA